MDSKYWTRNSESSKYRGCYAVGTQWLASIAICCTIKNLLDDGIRYAAVKALICRRLVPLLGRLHVCWGCPSLVMWDSSSRVERLRKRKYLQRMLFSFGSPGRPVESFCFGDANGGPAFRGPDARHPGLLLALHGHMETFSKVPKRLYRLFDAPFLPRPPPNGVFDLVGSILMSLEFARAKGSKDSTSECVVFCFRQGVATAAPLFVGHRVGKDHSPVRDVTVLVTFVAGGQGHALFVRAVACDLLWREGWDSMSKFQGAGREVFIVLIMVVQESAASESTGSRRGPCGDINPRVHVWAFMRPFPRPFQGGDRSNELLIVSL
ncbi:hypothetical protein CRG98_019173 [Punica granatum]|uniref:Uncharacterized protein n=1 Tax=Punica granatum TaxID=22663 RepID=A0A2I0JW01_PUNGR|nr:hypothetical protein CRG98_019173 [Punica granatum]